MNAAADDILRAFCRLAEGAFAAGRGARVVVAADPGHAVDLLTAGQMGSLAVVAYYEGDAADGEDFWDTRVRATVRAVLYRRQGLGAGGDAGLAGTLALADELRGALAGCELEGELGGLRYTGMTPAAAADGRMLNGYVLGFEVVYAHTIREDGHGG